MTINPRGSWSIHKAIEERWVDKGLDTAFRAEWPTPATTQYLSLNDSEARPGKPIHPTPYCVYEVGEPIILSHSTGAADDDVPVDTHRKYIDVPVQFTIYAIQKGALNGKEMAVQFAKLVARQFDRALYTLEEDEQIDVMIDPDFGTRQDDQTWSWTLQYRIRIEGKYLIALS